ncbi:MAG: peptidase, partial [Chloroflexales bacterium]|nr:peptidase [Chloroflexales bacterium]
MTQRIALTVAAALSAFMLVMIAGLATSFNRATVAAAPTEVPTVAPPTEATLDPTAQAIIAERDAAYQAALAEANARIAAANAQVGQANAQIEQANAQIEQANAAPAPAVAAPTAPAAPAAPAA